MPDTNQQTSQHELLQRYLLGDLSESEQERIEERYFTEDDYLDKLLIAENQLIEDYLSGTLTSAETKEFERNYLTTPEKNLRLQLVTRIHKQANEAANTPADLIVEQPGPEKTSWWKTALAALYPRSPVARFAFALGILIMVVGGVLLVNRNLQLRNQLAQADQERNKLKKDEAQLREQLADQQQRNNEIAQSLDQATEQRRLLEEQLSRQTQAKAAPVPSFELGGTESPRAGFVPRRVPPKPKPRLLVIPKDSKLVRLSFNVNTKAYQSYRLALLAANGAEIWSRSDELQRPGGAVTVHVPARLLNPGNYTFKLELLNEDGAKGVAGQYPVIVEHR